MILLDKKRTFVSASALARIGNPEYCALSFRFDGKQIILTKSYAMDPASTRVNYGLFQLARQQQLIPTDQLLVMENPPQYIPLLPDFQNEYLQIHGILTESHTLVFDVNAGSPIPLNVAHALYAMLIVPPGWAL